MQVDEFPFPDQFEDMAERVRRERELRRAGKLCRFYRICVGSILAHEPLGIRMQGEFKHIPHPVRQLLLDLEDKVGKLHQGEQLRRLGDERLALLEEEKAQLEEEKEQLEEQKALLEEEKARSEVEAMLTQTRLLESLEERAAEASALGEQVAGLQQLLDQERSEKARLKQQLEVSLEKHKRIEVALANAQQELVSLSESSSARLSQSLLEREEEVGALQRRLQASQILSSSISHSSVILSVTNHHALPPLLAQAIEGEMGRSVRGVERLYGFRQQRTQNPHRSIDNHPNILLICLCESGAMVGAFSSVGFSLGGGALGARGFLFGIGRSEEEAEEISVGVLKRGHVSVQYDSEFLIFGNDELCIEQGQSKLTSQFPLATENQLCFRRSLSEDHLLRALADGTVPLQNYEIFQVDFEDQ